MHAIGKIQPCDSQLSDSFMKHLHSAIISAKEQRFVNKFDEFDFYKLTFQHTIARSKKCHSNIFQTHWTLDNRRLSTALDSTASKGKNWKNLFPLNDLINGIRNEAYCMLTNFKQRSCGDEIWSYRHSRRYGTLSSVALNLSRDKVLVPKIGDLQTKIDRRIYL